MRSLLKALIVVVFIFTNINWSLSNEKELFLDVSRDRLNKNSQSFINHILKDSIYSSYKIVRLSVIDQNGIYFYSLECNNKIFNGKIQVVK